MSPPFAWYQWGHEIKAARFNLFFQACRWWGYELEVPVDEESVYSFDPLLNWLSGTCTVHAPLWSDARVMAVLHNQNEWLTPDEIAQRYTYPEMYVEAVLWPKIYSTYRTQQMVPIASAVASPQTESPLA